MAVTEATQQASPEDDDEPKIVEMAQQKFWALEGKGPFETCGKTFGELGKIAKELDLSANKTAMLVLCDVPNTKKEDLLWACGILMEEDSTDDKKKGGDETDNTIVTKKDDRLVELVAPGGKFATMIHKGDYAGLPKSWGTLCMKWIKSQRLCPRQGSRDMPHYEVYLNSCSDTPKENLRTQLFCPVEEEEPTNKKGKDEEGKEEKDDYDDSNKRKPVDKEDPPECKKAKASS